ncbi:MAG: hypothetical protein KC656_35480, partial [Myxococcales bacterium]|nr:hypothetical protein [Myxococcales bacterium]
MLTVNRDLGAGATTAVMLVPQVMAYALLAGIDPIHALYASTLPLVAYALVGSSVHLAVGPAALDSILVGSALVAVGSPEGREASDAAVLALLTGGILLVGGVLRLGRLARFLTPDVLAGFTTAAAFLIALSQAPLFVGVALPKTGSTISRTLQLLGSLPDARPAAVGVGGLTVVALLALKARAPRLPRYLLVVLLGIALVAAGVDVPVIGDVPAGLPGLEVPTSPVWLGLLPWAAVLALVATVEVLSIGTSLADPDAPIEPDREVFGTGLANVAAGLVGGMNVAAGFSRSAVHAEAGATTRLALVVCAAVVAAVLAGLTGPLAMLPNTTL